jgi:hypothetical protein
MNFAYCKPNIVATYSTIMGCRELHYILPADGLLVRKSIVKTCIRSLTRIDTYITDGFHSSEYLESKLSSHGNLQR